MTLCKKNVYNDYGKETNVNKDIKVVIAVCAQRVNSLWKDTKGSTLCWLTPEYIIIIYIYR